MSWLLYDAPLQLIQLNRNNCNVVLGKRVFLNSKLSLEDEQRKCNCWLSVGNTTFWINLFFFDFLFFHGKISKFLRGKFVQFLSKKRLPQSSVIFAYFFGLSMLKYHQHSTSYDRSLIDNSEKKKLFNNIDVIIIIGRNNKQAR